MSIDIHRTISDAIVNSVNIGHDHGAQGGIGAVSRVTINFHSPDFMPQVWQGGQQADRPITVIPPDIQPTDNDNELLLHHTISIANQMQIILLTIELQ